MTTGSRHTAPSYLLSRVAGASNARESLAAYRLTSSDVAILRQAAGEDALRYTFNATSSFLSAMDGLSNGSYAWSVVKLYYTAFYVGRATLARAGLVVFHVAKPNGLGSTQFETRLAPGESPRVVQRIPSTHKLIAQRFRDEAYPAFMQGLSVDGRDPVDWLMENREYWNYRAGRFSDPDPPDELARHRVERLQRLLAEYEADHLGVYLADTEHAMVAIPYRLLLWSLGESDSVSETVVSADEIEWLRKRCWTNTYRISALYNGLGAIVEKVAPSS